MATTKELESQVSTLLANVNELRATVETLKDAVSQQRDEVVVLKKNYAILVEDMSTRLEIIHNRFRSEGRKSGRA